MNWTHKYASVQGFLSISIDYFKKEIRSFEIVSKNLLNNLFSVRIVFSSKYLLMEHIAIGINPEQFCNEHLREDKSGFLITKCTFDIKMALNSMKCCILKYDTWILYQLLYKYK